MMLHINNADFCMCNPVYRDWKAAFSRQNPSRQAGGIFKITVSFKKSLLMTN